MGNPAEAQPTPRAKRSLRLLLVTLHDALGLVRRANARLFWGTMVGQLAGALLLGGQVYLGKLALDALLGLEEGGSVAAALLPVAALVVISIVTGLSGTMQDQGQRLLGEHLRRLTLDRVFDVTTRVPLDTYEGPVFFDDLSRVLANSLLRPLTLAQGLVQLAAGAIGIVGLCVVLAALQPLLLPILVVAALPLWVLSRRQGRLEYAFELSQTRSTRWRDYLTELLTGREEAKELRAFGLGPRLRGSWSTSYATYLDDLAAHVRRLVGVGLAGALLSALVTIAAFAALVALVASDRLSLAEAGAAAIAVRLLAARIQALFVGIGRIFESSLFIEDLERFVARVPPDDRPAPTSGDLGTFESVELQAASFAYPGVEEEALHDVSVRIDAGEVVALVGENGSGKTTLAKVMARLLHPTGGRLLWNGVDAREHADDRLREQVGVIFQDFVRYNATLATNIAFGAPARPEDRGAVEEAARRAGADVLAARSAAGYDTELGKVFDGGQDLSLGQWQRVALARAFYRGAPFLILDEPTASLDARAEHELFEHVRRLAEGRAVLLISHRFSTVRFADRIYVLERGRVVEEGDHSMLVELEGRYAEMFRLQADAYQT